MTLNDKEFSRPHSDWQLNFAFFHRFPWPENKMQWFNGIPTCAMFATTEKKQYEWSGKKHVIDVVVTTVLDFHEPQESFKKQAIALAKAMNIGIQEPKKHVYFSQDRFKDD